MQNLKIGIIGLGSIGIRHATELVSLGVSRIYALRTNKGAKEIPKELIGKIHLVTDKTEFLRLELDGYLISNPTSLHIETLVELKNCGKPVFVEKPLASDLHELDKLKQFNSDLIQVGFCLRFLSIIKKVKELIANGELGNVYQSRLNAGQYLPTWHPYTDYREEYFSRKELGGGALRTLSHELDLALYFFGRPDSSAVRSAHTSSLEIDTDDYSLVTLSYGRHICRIELDFLSKKKVRNGVIYGELGDLHYDVFSNQIEIYNPDGLLVLQDTVEPNNMYKDQMKVFLEFVVSGSRDQTAAGFAESIDLMKIIADERLI